MSETLTANPVHPRAEPSPGPWLAEPSAPGVLDHLSIIDRLLRDRDGFLRGLDDERHLLVTARTLIIALAVSAGVFGASLGFFRGGVQILFAAVKLALVVLLTAAVATPALSGLRRALGGCSTLAKDAALVLGSLTLGGLVLSALAPVVLLITAWSRNYHLVILLTVGCCMMAGLVSISLLMRGMRQRLPSGHVTASIVLLAVFGLVGTQMSWLFRPYVVRPRTPEVVFMRSNEGSFMDSVLMSMDSARGVYRYQDPAITNPGD